MANLTWAPNSYLLNIPTVSNVTTSVTGAGSIATLQTQVNAILSMVDTTNKKIKTNSISNFSTTPIQVTNAINFAAGATGISTTTSSITGDYCIKSGNLYVSSMGATVTCATGNIFCDGQVFANGTVCPSDPSLKTNVRGYDGNTLPTPVRFKWKESGKEDIGFLATDVLALVPEAVSLHPNGLQMVDYGKLVVAAIAEIKSLQQKVQILEEQLLRK
jgi:hypothetical protein